VRYLGNLQHDQVPCALACCDVLALPYRRSEYLDAASSCKIAEYIAMRRPIVATRTPNMLENFPSQAAHLKDLLAEPGDPADLARVIEAQFATRRLVTLPREMEWSAIASVTLSSLVIASE
jgi:glycosyltransferase involved in cell wall biosynthesis